MSKKNSATKQGKRTIGAPPPAPPLPGPQPTSANTRTRGSGLRCSIAAIVLLVALVAGAALGAPRLLALLANGATAGGELTAGAAHDLLVEQQAPAIAQLTSYGWIDKEQGVAHIPIERAITLLASSDLPVGALAAVPQTESAATTGDGAIPANLNFTDHILPIFQDRCSECHGDNDPEEGLVLTSYKDVMLGSWYGAVVKPGDPAGSYLVELVETGQMPKKGDDLTPEQ
ncbi:MAG: hypothetical protein KDE47_07600, partial [Caldilineaceae bacterium]|nr:hypothetical protein [Caldilineaceae bacterium]